ncbi:MAG: ABC transporter permease [Bacteroides sp.]|nr:ABC transporter permease [Bacteroides sp.]
MKQFYYVLQTVFHGRSSYLIKVLSLGLGLTMTILLYCRVVFEQSFDTEFRQPENLYQLWSVFTINNEKKEPQELNNGPLAGAVMEHFPQEVEAATSLSKYWLNNPLFLGNAKFDDVRVVTADSLFFHTMGVDLMCGTPVADLQQKDVIYLSESLARRIFPDGSNPIGRMINTGKQIDLTIKGIFRDIPENSSLRADAVISLPTLLSRGYGNYSWEGGDSWHGYVRLHSGVDVEVLNQRIHQAIQQVLPAFEGWGMTAYLQPIRDTHRNYKLASNMCLIFFVLATSILFIMSLNYVLISISSLTRRAKAVGVHKCSGATGGTIFSMFLWETLVIIILALMLGGVLLWLCSDLIEDNIIPLRFLLVPRMIWVALGVLFALFLIGGVLPALTFSRIPVTQVFKKYTEGKRGWKRSLLFVEFAGVTFIAGLMCIVMLQYHHILTKDTGYNPDRIAYGWHPTEDLEAIDACKKFYSSLPYVEEMTSAIGTPFSYSGEYMLDEAGKPLFSARYDYTEGNYTQVMGIPLLEGRLPNTQREVAVNQTWVEWMHLRKEDVIGRMIDTEEGKVKITGIIRDFTIGSFFDQPAPFVLHYKWYFGNMLHIRLKEPFVENLQRLNQEASEAFSTLDLKFIGMQQRMVSDYHTVHLFRNTSVMATVVVLFITLMGLVGYVSDETARRSKEIAIRKVNGAESTTILEMLSRDVLLLALPAVWLGAVLAWLVSDHLLQLFSTVFGSTTPYYIIVSLLVLFIVVGCVLWKSWCIANENPVKSIQSE